MAPIKFEEDIRDKMAERRIEPSLGSWDKLSAQLDQDSKGRSKFWWLAVAASFLLVLFTVFQVVESETEIAPIDRFSREKYLDVEGSVESKKEVEITSPMAIGDEQGIAYEQKEQARNTITEPITGVPATVTQQAMVSYESYEREVKVPSENYIKNEEVTDALASNIINETPVKELLNETKHQQFRELNKETDSLLKAAQKQLLLNKAMTKKTTVVKASELLMEVEDEVEPSLKSKVYEVFKGGFKRVKTAVVQRNN